jgi:hypothetical protein
VWSGQPLALPSVFLDTNHLADLANAAARGATGRPTSPYQYLLGFVDHETVPAPVVHTARMADLAAVTTSYHDNAGSWRWVA